MSYCQFRNTLGDLRDCYEDMDHEDISPEEEDARRRLVNLCLRIADDFAVVVYYRGVEVFRAPVRGSPNWGHVYYPPSLGAECQLALRLALDSDEVRKLAGAPEKGAES
jgi:hypothetical protein